MDILCKTQQASIHSISAPSGIKYTSLKGIPFKVDDKEDVAFFTRQPGRYDVIGIIQRVVNKIVPPEQKASATANEEKELEKFLLGINVLSGKSRESIMKTYANMNNLYAEFIGDATFQSIPAAQAKALIRALDDYDEEKHNSAEE